MLIPIKIEAYIDLSSSTGGANLGCGTSGNGCWPFFQGSSKSVRGMRLSLLNANGSRLPYANRSYNIIAIDNDLNTLNDGYGYYYWQNSCSKVEYGKGDCSLGSPVKKEKGDSLSYILRGADSLNLSAWGVSTSSIRNYMQSDNLSAIWEPIGNTPKEQRQYYRQLVGNLFFNGNADWQENLSEEDLKGTYLVVEPLTYIYYNKKFYLGTFHELASIGYSSMVGAESNLHTAIDDAIPCSAYLATSAARNMIVNKAPGVKESGSITYFNGKLTVDSKQACSAGGTNKHRQLHDASYGKANMGVGIGVIWFGPLNETDKVTCDMVNKGANFNVYNYATNLYNSGRISEWLGDTTTITFKDANGATKNVSTKWYVNECTCYGMYDQFTNGYMNSIYSRYPDFNNVNNKYGVINWKDRFPAFTDVKQKRLNIVFNDTTFKNYNTYWENYAKEKDVTWTPASEKKFTDMNCGPKQTSWWCNELETWYSNTISKNNLKIKSIKNMTVNEIKTKQVEITDMFNAYNKLWSVANGFSWTLYQNQGGNYPTYSYIDYCKTNSSGTSHTPTCATVNKFYGTTLSQKSCSYLSTFDFSDYNNVYGTNINSDWYETKCGCKNISVTNCTPNTNITNCQTGGNIIYQDRPNGVDEKTYWNDCVFNDNGVYDNDVHKTSSNGAFTYYEDSLSNQYCEVYCIEEMTANFQGSVNAVKAGGHFVWDNHSVSGSRTCKTKSIDYDGFISDLTKANKDTENKYYAWQFEIKKKAVIDSAKRSNNLNCDYRCDYNSHGISCCETATRDWECKKTERKCVESHREHYHYVCDKYEDTCTSWGWSNYYCTKSNNQGSYYGYTYTPTNVTYRGQSTGVSSWCSTSGKPSTNVASKQSAYNSAVRYANGLVSDINDCSSWSNSDVYNLNPSIDFNYSDGHYSADGSFNSSSSNYYANVDSDCKDVAVGVVSCANDRCTRTYKSVNKCTYYSKQVSETVNFYLPSDLYSRIDKTTHESILGTSEFQQLINAYGENTFNYINLGYGNFPVAFSTKDGLYGYGTNQGELSLTYSNLGHYGSAGTIVDNILSTINGNDYNNWQCNYSVVSKLITDDNKNNGDIKVIYRPIDLDNPFPDIDGNGRSTGTNWCGRTCSNNPNYNEVVKTAITNNRGVKTEEVYNKEPMYTFILTPADISNIRKYNKVNSYTSYTGSIDNKNYDFVCKDKEGRECISEYLGELLKQYGYGKNLNGSCSYENGSRRTNFNSCRTVK